MPRGAIPILRSCAAALLLVVTAVCLCELAQWQFTQHQRDVAAQALALAATGETPWHWSYRRHDLIAGRVFGNADADFADDCLIVRSRGEPFEIGLRLARTLPLRNFPRLRLFAYPNAAAQARLVVRERLDGTERTSARFLLAGVSTPTDIDVEKVEWSAPNGAVMPAPAVAAMLRLRFSLPKDVVLQFNGATLNRPAHYKRLDLSRKVALAELGSPMRAGIIPVYQVPDVGFDAIQVAAIARTSLPILALAQAQRVERQRLMLDAVHDVLPTAIVVPQDALEATFAQARALATRSAVSNTSEVSRWIALIAFAAALLLARVFPPHQPRIRAALEIALVLAAPLWLVIGGHFTGEVSAAQKFLIACVTAYALSLGFPRDWSWHGSGRAWLLGAAVVLPAAGIGLAAHFSGSASMRPVGWAHVLRYFGWALSQQYLVCVVCTIRWLRVTDNTWIAVYLGALCFALLHTPNANLMLATFVGGLCWCTLFVRERALLPLAFSHAASALVLITLLPPSWLYSAEVSARFFQ